MGRISEFLFEKEYIVHSSLVKELVKNDFKLMKKDRYLQNGGFKTLRYFEKPRVDTLLH